MAIARVHGTAGEGDARPCDSTNTTDEVSSTDAALSTDDVNLPWVILRAVYRAARLDGVPARARALLAALARTVDAKKPYADIFAGRTLLTERAMQSERTFYRSLTDLEAAGLIDRRPQRRYVDQGLFGRAYLQLTERAAVLLGLVEEGVATPAETFTQPTDSVADGANTKDLIPTAFQKRQPEGSRAKQANQPPEDLQRLRALGFGDFLIFRLMREAREAAKRLSDVVEVCWTSLRKATRPINYLRALLASPTDFGHQLRARHAEQKAAQDATEEREIATAAVRNFDRKSFVDASGERRYVVGEGGTVLTVYRADEGIARQVAGEWATNFLRAIKSGHIICEMEAALPTTTAAEHGKHSGLSRAIEPRVLTTEVSAHLSQLRQLCRRAA